MPQGLYGGQCVEKHTAYIMDRGGERRIAELRDLYQVQWDRRRDSPSEGTVYISGAACSAQSDTLSMIEPHRHELVIFRGDERVWEGPVNRVGWHSDWVEVNAHDVMEYLNYRPLTQVYDNGGVNATEVTTRLQGIIEYELQNSFSYSGTGGAPVIVPAWEAIDPPINVLPHIVFHNFPNEARTAAVTEAFQMSVAEHMDNYAHTGGIDYTVVGRAIHIWDTSRPLGYLPTLTEADFFGEIILTAYGSEHATGAFVTSQSGGYGGAGGDDPFYGPWVKMFTVYDEDETDVPTQAELNSQAQRNLAGRNPVPLTVRIPDNSGIRLRSDLTIDDLVPGAYVPLLATLNSRTTSQMQKLDKVVVKETADGETISVTMVPSTNPDSDVEDDEE